MVVRRTVENRLTPDAAEFVRFCYRRRFVGWPELYDEMCAVAMRRLFRGWDMTELARHGIGFGLEATPILAELVERVVAEELAAKRARRGARPLGPVREPDQSRPSGGEGRPELRAGVAGAAVS